MMIKASPSIALCLVLSKTKQLPALQILFLLLRRASPTKKHAKKTCGPCVKLNVISISTINHS